MAISFFLRLAPGLGILAFFLICIAVPESYSDGVADTEVKIGSRPIAAKEKQESHADQVNRMSIIGLLKLIEELHREAERLKAEDNLVLANILAKRRIALSLVAAEIDLVEAAVGFHTLDRSAPRFPWETFNRLFPGNCSLEHHCREVVAYIRGLPKCDCQEQELLVRRLDSEVQSIFQAGCENLPARIRAEHSYEPESECGTR
jgi:hypothetical protein